MEAQITQTLLTVNFWVSALEFPLLWTKWKVESSYVGSNLYADDKHS